jgi:hypothetical protein
MLAGKGLRVFEATCRTLEKIGVIWNQAIGHPPAFYQSESFNSRTG